MEKVKDIAAFVITGFLIIGVVVLLLNMEIQFRPINSTEFYTFIGMIVALIVGNMSLKRVESFVDRKTKELGKK